MSKTVRLCLWWNHGEPDENAFPDAPELGKDPHAQVAMKHMGITYKDAWPQPISDSWTFYGCDNVPPPPYPRWMKVREE
jgi:hypothetical protein